MTRSGVRLPLPPPFQVWSIPGDIGDSLFRSNYSDYHPDLAIWINIHGVDGHQNETAGLHNRISWNFRMKLAAFTTFLPEYTFSDACHLIKEIGYEGVQPRIVSPEKTSFDPTTPVNPWSNHRGSLSEDDFIADPLSVLKPAFDLGLNVPSVASYLSVEKMDRATLMMKACAQAGIKNIRIAPLPIPKEQKFDYWSLLDRNRALYKELAVEAKKVGVRVCAEIHHKSLNPTAASVMAILRGLSPENVGVLFDPGNMVCEGNESLHLALNILGPYLAEVHVKNAFWSRESPNEAGAAQWKIHWCNLEDGLADWSAIIPALKLHGYDGWIIEEGINKERRTEERLRKAHEFLSRLIGVSRTSKASTTL
jgi:sugar phosphate isomerase/epimerase